MLCHNHLHRLSLHQTESPLRAGTVSQGPGSPLVDKYLLMERAASTRRPYFFLQMRKRLSSLNEPKEKQIFQVGIWQKPFQHLEMFLVLERRMTLHFKMSLRGGWTDRVGLAAPACYPTPCPFLASAGVPPAHSTVR